MPEEGVNMSVVRDRSCPLDSREKSQIALIWREFRRHYLAVARLLVIVTLIAVAFLTPYLTPYDPAKQDLGRVLVPPSRSHLMGTDDLGRDILSRVIVSSRVSLSVAFIAVAILVTIGVLVGMLAGYYRSLDGPLMRVVDLLMSVPNTFLILTIVALFGRDWGIPCWSSASPPGWVRPGWCAASFSPFERRSSSRQRGQWGASNLRTKYGQLYGLSFDKNLSI